MHKIHSVLCRAAETYLAEDLDISRLTRTETDENREIPISKTTNWITGPFGEDGMILLVGKIFWFDCKLRRKITS